MNKPLLLSFLFLFLAKISFSALISFEKEDKGEFFMLRFLCDEDGEYTFFIDTKRDGVFDARDSVWKGKFKKNEYTEIIWRKKGIKSAVYGALLLIDGRERIKKQFPIIIHGPSWYEGDLHVHTRHFSEDAIDSIERMVKGAVRYGFEFIAFTDHANKEEGNINSEKEWKKAKESYLEYNGFLTVLPGHEITPVEGGAHINVIGKDISFYMGDMGLDTEDVLRKIELEEGVAILNHPARTVADGGRIDWKDIFSSFICIEDYCRKKGAPPFFRDSLAKEQVYKAWSEGKKVWIVGSSDAHSLWSHSFGREFTRVYASSPTYSAILEGIKKGCMYIVYNNRKGGEKDAPNMHFFLIEGRKKAMIGECLNAKKAILYIKVEAAEDDKVKRVRCIRDGEIFFDKYSDSVIFEYKKDIEAKKPLHWFCIEVITEKGDIILSNPIFLRKKE